MAEHPDGIQKITRFPKVKLGGACALAVAVGAALLFCLAFSGVAPAHATQSAKPAKAVLSSVKSPSKGKVTVKVKAAARAKGYQYQVSANKAFTKNVKSKLAAKRSATFTGLKAGKKYYVKARAYAKSGAKKVYGAWSKVRTVTVSKKSSNAGNSGGNMATQVVTKEVATVKLRTYGTFKITLYPEYAPNTVANFKKLANSGFYDGLTFHRMVAGFCLQGGDPNGNGTGGSPETIIGEFWGNGIWNPLAQNFQRGVVAMARSDNNNSASSQFFVTLGPAPHLNGDYAAFGYVDATGMTVVDKAAQACAGLTDSGGLVADKSKQPVITSIRVSTVTETVYV